MKMAPIRNRLKMDTVVLVFAFESYERVLEFGAISIRSTEAG